MPQNTQYTDAIMRILNQAGEPISDGEMMRLGEEIYGEDWKKVNLIRLKCIRTALRSVGVVTHPKRGSWGLTPDAAAQLDRWKAVGEGGIWREHLRLRDEEKQTIEPAPPDPPQPRGASILELTKTLVETWGPSGYEHRIRDLIREEVAALADETWLDGLGNLICRVGSGGKKVLIAAHMDEIGLMANYQEPESGYLRFTNLGGLRPDTLNGNRVQFEDGTVGVIAAQEGGGQALSDFYIDVQNEIGGNATAVGQPAGFMREMQTRGARIVAKSLDDRIGCVVAIEAMRRLNKSTPNELYFAFTVQEEVGLRGAKTAAQSLHPDIGIAVDVTGSGDQIRGRKMQVRLGGGAAIKVHDPGLVVPVAIKNWMIERCEADGIPYQLELLAGGTTDASAIQLADAGVPSGCISIPTRYLHTTSETVDIGDVNACIDLLSALLANPIEL
ncbi:MAG: M20/M25/M40 family metallo-hydrolase [Chloroflexi bacterium]|nr:M20/M25/M40 family metallo-hydrolase [Chloroflexota bacterium]